MCIRDRVYSTCTLNPAENQGVFGKFLRDDGRFVRVPIEPACPGAVKEEILRLSHAFMYLTFSGHIISLLAFVMNVRYRFTYMEGEFERRCWLGFYNGRLWGFFTNPNAASNFAVRCV